MCKTPWLDSHFIQSGRGYWKKRKVIIRLPDAFSNSGTPEYDFALKASRLIVTMLTRTISSSCFLCKYFCTSRICHIVLMLQFSYFGKKTKQESEESQNNFTRPNKCCCISVLLVVKNCRLLINLLLSFSLFYSRYGQEIANFRNPTSTWNLKILSLNYPKFKCFTVLTLHSCWSVDIQLLLS